MTLRPSVPEVITVNSEQLQSQVRDLLPSQAGFGSELQATNVIVPIIDLTQTAQGSTLPLDLSSALAFGSQTAVQFINSSATIITAPGFYRIFGTTSIDGNNNTQIAATDGATTTILAIYTAGTAGTTVTYTFDFNVWVKPGTSITASSSAATAVLSITHRQIADTEGSIVNPSGFPV